MLPVLPALRWSGETGYGLDAPEIGRWLDQGAVGFILFGGTADAAREAADWLRDRGGRTLLLGADLERGAGQQFRGATSLPPLAALASAGDRERLFEAGALTGREALALGVPWVFAPVADLALEPRNPIVGTRAPGADPGEVARAVTAWIEGCLSVGAIPCAKHFPGHGRTLEDSHRALPVVEADRDTLSSTDWVPFRAAIECGVPSIMTAHVAYPALDPSGRPATRSRPILTDLLRDAMGFEGVVVTDALIMDGVGDGATAIVEALGAGVDLLLYPPAELPVKEILQAAAVDGRLDADERQASRARVEALLSRVARVPSSGVHLPSPDAHLPSSGAHLPPPGTEASGDPTGITGWGSEADRSAALRWAVESLDDGGWEPGRPGAVSLTVVDDDVGGPYPAPSRDVFPAALREAGIAVFQVGTDGGSGAPSPRRGEHLPLLCVYSEPRAWKGRAGLSPESRARVQTWMEEHRGRGGVVAFGGPTLRAELPSDLPVLMAWGGEALLQRAVAERLAR